MLDAKKLVELREKIEEEAKKYHITNIAIAATNEDTMDFPFQFIGDCENMNIFFHSIEDRAAFISYLKAVLLDEGASFSTYSEIKEFIDYGIKSFQFRLDTAIPLRELDPNKSFKEQFEERKERAEKERLENSQGIKRKSSAKDEEALNINDAEADATLPLSDSESKKLWQHKVTSQKRPRLEKEVDEKKVEEVFDKIFSDLEAFNELEVRSLQQRLNSFLSSKSKEEHSVG
jgi:hypothetical protein